MRKKKELQERKAALIAENGEHLARINQESFSGDVQAELKAVDARESEIEQLDAEIKSIEKLEQRTRENAARGGNEAPNSSPQKFATLGEQLMAVYTAATTGRADARLAPSGAGEGSPSDGGFLVQQDFMQDLMTRTYSTGAVSSRCRQLTISSPSNSVVIPAVNETSRVNGSRFGGVQTYWSDEAGALTQSQAKFKKMELRLKKLTALTYVTDELLEDAAVLNTFIQDAFVQEMGFVIDDSIINGTGVGKPLGILNAACTVSQAAEGSQTADTVNMANITKMWARLYAPSQQNAVWFINQDVYPQLYQLNSAATSSATPVFLPPGGLSASPYSSLMGRPIIPIEQCATVGDVGDIILADLGQYYLAKKGTIRTDSSMHVKFTTDEMAFRFITRLDGQPRWSSALTPFKGSNTQSPFITLAAR